MRPAEDRAAEIATLLSRLGELLGEGFQRPAPAESKRPMPQRVLFTPEEAAEALGVGRTTVYALIKSGFIDSVRIGHLRRIPTDALAPCVARLAARDSSPAA